jgi:hypothetical protein
MGVAAGPRAVLGTCTYAARTDQAIGTGGVAQVPVRSSVCGERFSALGAGAAGVDPHSTRQAAMHSSQPDWCVERSGRDSAGVSQHDALSSGGQQPSAASPEPHATRASSTQHASG